MGKLIQTVTANAVIPLSSWLAKESGVPTEYVTGLTLLFYTYALAKDANPKETEEFSNKLDKAIKNAKDELVKSNELRQSTIRTLDSFTRQRRFERRELMRTIYFNLYIPAEKREDVELERFLDVSDNISIGGLQFLLVIKNEILPYRLQRIREEVQTEIKTTDYSVYPAEWLVQNHENTEPFSMDVAGWTDENYCSKAHHNNPKPTHANAREQALWDKKMRDELDGATFKHAEFAAELQSLGIYRPHVKGYHISDFGRQFINLIPALVLKTDN